MHSGYVGLVGRPNVGKSTLLNALIEAKISIVSAKPQTTRNRISGIFTNEAGQIVFLDTPGIHRGEGDLNKYMVEVALGSLADVDVICVLMEATSPPGGNDKAILEKVFAAKRPVVLVLNKIDKVQPAQLLPLIEQYKALGSFEAIVPVAAINGDGVSRLRNLLLDMLPEQPPFFPEDQLTEVQERFIAAETIREKIFEMLREEVPYSTAVEIESYDEADPKIIRISAAIAVERDGQKGILIGKGGATLKEIGTRARKDLEQFLGTKVFLELFVKVVPDWSKRAGSRKRFGYE
jgi:GTP-binding protein Era